MFEVNSLVKNFAHFRALGPLSFNVDQEHIVTVIGPSGCGKSTLLRLLAGLESATQGDIILNGYPVNGTNKEIAVAFQEPRLMPWLNVYQNIELGIWDWPLAQRQTAITQILKKVSLTEFANALPKQLSGGMAQRVGLARALAGRPKLLLMDEPFSALDPLTRIKMQDHLLEMVGSDVPNILLITHDIDEALVLSDRILVLAGPPAVLKRDLIIDLAKPRKRSAPEFQSLKLQLLEELFPDDKKSLSFQKG